MRVRRSSPAARCRGARRSRRDPGRRTALPSRAGWRSGSTLAQRLTGRTELAGGFLDDDAGVGGVVIRYEDLVPGRSTIGPRVTAVAAGTSFADRTERDATRRG